MVQHALQLIVNSFAGKYSWLFTNIPDCNTYIKNAIIMYKCIIKVNLVDYYCREIFNIFVFNTVLFLHINFKIMDEWFHKKILFVYLYWHDIDASSYLKGKIASF